MWQDITGQTKATTILQRSISRGQVAHAYLFAGPRGVGKKKAALQFAKSIFCQNAQNGDSCEACINCQRINHGNHPDLHVIEPDGASIKINQIRELRKEFTYTSVESSAKVYILLEADTMTREAANSILKFLEEPGRGVTAILVTSNTNGLLPTILSRCQIISFTASPWQEIALEVESRGISKGNARVAAQLLGNIEEVYNFCQREAFAQMRKIVLKFYKDIYKQKSQSMVRLHELIFSDQQMKEEVDLFLNLSIIWFRDLSYLKIGKEDLVANVDYVDTLKKQVEGVSLQKIALGMEVMFQTEGRLKWMNRQLALEQMILHLQEGKSYV